MSCYYLSKLKYYLYIQVNSENVHIVGGGFWGHCDLEKCPLPSEVTDVGQDGQVGSDEEVVSEGFEGDDQVEGLDSFLTCTTTTGAQGECKPIASCIGLSDTEVSVTLYGIRSRPIK